MFRFFYVISLLTKYFFIYLSLKLGFYKKPKEKILRNFFEEAGGAFIKFGQLLALRIDILPKEYAIEMIRLFDNVGPFPYSDVEKIFLQELGVTPSKIFKDFQKEPFASASFGQVHGAKLENDHIVAVKILRPGIEDKVEADFLIIDVIAFVADLFMKVEALPWKEFAAEFKKWTRNELDYRVEIENMEEIGKTATDDKYIVIPKIYHRLSTKRILVEDYIEGIPLSRVLLGLKDGRLDEEKLQNLGINIKIVTKIISREIFKQFFFGKIFHADPHPGNILLLQNNKIALIDFGIVGECLKYNRVSFVEFVEAASKIDFKKATYHFANFSGGYLKNMIGSALPATVSQKEVDEFMNIISNYFAEEVEKIVSEKRRKLEQMQEDYTLGFLDVLKAARKLRVKLPKEAVLFVRTLTIAGFLAKQLNITYKLSDEVYNFFKEFPKETWLNPLDDTPPYKRISHEKAIEQLNGWLSYLIEVDVSLYHVVKNQLKKYNLIDK